MRLTNRLRQLLTGTYMPPSTMRSLAFSTGIDRDGAEPVEARA